MSKVYPITESKFAFYCPGCKENHWFKTDAEKPSWKWNENFSKPSVTPSIMAAPGTKNQCHLFIRDGQIEYLKDSWHNLRGQTVPMEEWE